MKERKTKLWEVMLDLINVKKPRPEGEPEPDRPWDCDEDGHKFSKWEVVKQNMAQVKLTGATIMETNQKRTCSECGFVQTHYHRSDNE